MASISSMEPAASRSVSPEPPELVLPKHGSGAMGSGPDNPGNPPEYDISLRPPTEPDDSADADMLFARSQAKVEDIDRKLMVAMGKEFNQLSEE